MALQDIQRLITSYVHESGALTSDFVHLGPAEELKATDEKRQVFIETLTRQFRVKHALIWIITGVYLVILLAALALVYYQRNNPANYSLVIGGSVLTLTVLGQRLLSLWRIATAIDLLIPFLQELSPQEGVKALESFLLHTQGSNPQPVVSEAT